MTIEPLDGPHGDKLHHDLAKSVLLMAALGGMPDTFWLTDRRLGQALYMLGWSPERGRRWARRQARLPTS